MMLRGTVVSFAFVCACCIVSILYLDQSILLYLQANRAVVLPVFTELSRLGHGTVWFALAAIVLLVGLAVRYHLLPVKLDASRLIFIGGFALSSLLLAGLIARLLKWGIGRWRPKFFLENGLYDFVPFSAHGAYKAASLPSGHSQTIATVCMLIALLRPKWAPGLLLLALLVAASRMVLLEHFLADVMAGLWLGAIVPLILWRYHPACLRARQRL